MEYDQTDIRVNTNWDGIPSDLKGKKLWVCWRPVPEKGKVPFCSRDGGRRASSTNPDTWGTYQQAKNACEMFPNSFAGPGLMLKEGLLGCDLDKCRDPETGEIEEWAWDLIHKYDTYSELSPSGKGVKMLMYAKFESLRKRLVGIEAVDLLPKKQKPYRGGETAIEFYDVASPRYFTVTGERVPGAPDTINLRQEEFESIYMDVFDVKIRHVRDHATRRKKARAEFAAGNPHGIKPGQQEVLDLACSHANGEKFRLLWEGDYENDKVRKADGTKYPSHSEADVALCEMAAFYFGPDGFQEIYDFFRASGLLREYKDNEYYIGRTVRTGLAFAVNRGEFFNWDYRKLAKKTAEQQEILKRICTTMGVVPIIPETVAQEPPRVAAEPGFNLDAYRDDPLFSWLWEGRHGQLVRDIERVRRIKSILQCLRLVPDGGFFRKYIEIFTRGSDMNIIYNIGSAVSLAGHLMNRKVYKQMGGGRLGCNMWMGLIGASTTGRKSQALSNSKKLLSLDPDYYDTVAPSQFSLNSLLDVFGSPIPKPAKGEPTVTMGEVLAEVKMNIRRVDEGSLAEYTKGVAIFHCDEIASLIDEITKNNNSGVHGCLMNMYDCPESMPPSHYRTAPNVVICRPCPSILGCSTSDNLTSKLTSIDLESGFLPRWILIPSFPDEKDLILPDPDPIYDRDLEPLQVYLDHFKACRGERMPTNHALMVYSDWYRETIGTPSDELESWKHRLAVAAWKFAMIFQADLDGDANNPEIDVPAVRLATLFTDELHRRLNKLWPDFGFTIDERNSTRVFRLIDKYGSQGIEQTPLLALLRGKASYWRPYLDSLVEQGRVEVGTRGTTTKSANVYRSTRHACFNPIQ